MTKNTPFAKKQGSKKNQVFDYQSSNYQKYKNPNPLQRWLILRFYDVITEMISDTGENSLLDAGCGEGLSIQNITRKGQELNGYGIDLSFCAIQVAKKLHSRFTFLQGDVLNLPFKNNSFKLVFCLEVLEHLKEPEQGLKEILRVSERFMLLSVPNEPYFRIANFLRGKNISRWGDDVGHLQHWSVKGFIKFISQQTNVITWRASFPWIIVLCQKCI